MCVITICLSDKSWTSFGPPPMIVRNRFDGHVFESDTRISVQAKCQFKKPSIHGAPLLVAL